MEKLIRNTWGKDMTQITSECVICKKNNNLYFCNNCYNVCYCSVNCQKQDWKRHDCKKILIQNDINDLPEEIIYLIVKWLSVQDLKNLNSVSLNFNQRIRKYLFKRKQFNLSRLDKRDIEQFKQIADFVENVKVSEIWHIQLLSSNVRKITFRDMFNKKVDLSQFEYLTHITFGMDFNQSIEKKLPPNLKFLEFGMWFNQEVFNLLPTKLTHLYFDHSFNKKILGGLPPKVTHLRFGFNFDQKVENGLPNSLTHLQFRYMFKQPLGDNLPPNLKELYLPSDYPNDFRNNLPNFTVFTDRLIL